MMRVNLIYASRQLHIWDDVLLKDIPNARLLQKESVGIVEKYVFLKYLKSSIEKGDINIIPNTYLGYILNFTRLENTVFWCWDICPTFLDYFTLKNKLWAKYNLAGMLKSDIIVAASENTKKDLIKYANCPEDKIRVVYAGVDHNIFKKYGKNEIQEARKAIRLRYGIKKEKLVLYVGGEQPRKNLPTLLRSLHELNKTMSAKLIIIGPQDWGKKVHDGLVSIIRELSIEKEVVFAGNLPHENLAEFYNAADVFAFPSYYEGFGLPPLEAMACGCPVVTTSCSSIPEVVGNAALLIANPFDHVLLAKKMESVLSDDALRADMVSEGIKQAAKFSWKNYTKGIYEVCREIHDKNNE